MTPLNAALCSSAVFDFLENFKTWRFAREGKNQKLTIWMINGEYPNECLSVDDSVIIFESGKKYQIKGMGF